MAFWEVWASPLGGIHRSYPSCVAQSQQTLWVVYEQSKHTVTTKTKSMLHLVWVRIPYVENEWTESEWENMNIVVSFVHYNPKRTWSKKQLLFGSKWIPKLTTL